MGPWATVDLMSRILKLTPARKEWDHIRTVVDSNVKIPSRTRAHLFNEPSPAPGMADSIRRLAAYPVDFVVIPCNSACCFLPEVEVDVDIPVVNIVDVVADAVRDRGCRNPGLLAGFVPWARGVYRDALSERGVAIVHPDEAHQAEVAAIIERLKSLDSGPETMTLVRSVISHLREGGGDSLIFGCTELSLVEDELREMCDLPLFFSTDILAEEVVRRALSSRETSA